MNRQQVILVAGASALLLILFFFGRTIPPHDHKHDDNEKNEGQTTGFNLESMLSTAKQTLSPERQAYINSLESSVVRGDVKSQQIHVYHQLASFWKDSVYLPPLYSYYTASASKLENSEKSLTFAARLFLDNLRGAEDPALRSWMAGQGKELFEKILVINPANDSAKIGLGSCYIFGSRAENPQEVMQGIQKILEVSRKDSSNMYAQLMLGIGGLVSGQLDKATERLLKVVNNEPANLEAILTLAEVYERQGDKANAVKWYSAGKQYITNPEVITVIDEKINLLK